MEDHEFQPPSVKHDGKLWRVVCRCDPFVMISRIDKGEAVKPHTITACGSYTLWAPVRDKMRCPRCQATIDVPPQAQTPTTQTRDMDVRTELIRKAMRDNKPFKVMFEDCFDSANPKKEA